MTILSGDTLSPKGRDGPLTRTDPASTAPVNVTDALRMPFSRQNSSMVSCRISPSFILRTKALFDPNSADLMKRTHLYLLYLSSSLPILSASSLDRSPASTNVLTKSLASLVDVREALAMTLARNADALLGSIVDSARIWFISYLKGLMRWVFSIACLRVDSFVLTCLFFFPLSNPSDSLGWLTTTLFLLSPLASMYEIAFGLEDVCAGFDDC